MNHLKYQRIANEWSREALGKRAHINPAAITAIEQARYIPTAREAARLAEALGLPVELLLVPVEIKDVRPAVPSPDTVTV
jgi:transcriptional regulator with XRE-family HTH domain